MPYPHRPLSHTEDAPGVPKSISIEELLSFRNKPGLAAARALRNWEEANPGAAVLAGFTPIAFAQSAAALRDPEAPMWEKGLSSLDFGPLKAVSGAVDLAKGLRTTPEDVISELDVYHGGVKHEGPPTAGRIGGEGTYDEGPGYYTTPYQPEAESYARNARQYGEGTLYKYDLPDEHLQDYVNLDEPFVDQTANVQQGLQELYPDADAGDDLVQTMKDQIWKARHDYDEPYRMAAMAAGLRGVRTNDPAGGRNTGKGEYFSTFNPDDLRDQEIIPTGSTAPTFKPKEDAYAKSLTAAKNLIKENDDLIPAYAPKDATANDFKTWLAGKYQGHAIDELATSPQMLKNVTKQWVVDFIKNAGVPQSTTGLKHFDEGSSGAVKFADLYKDFKPQNKGAVDLLKWINNPGNLQKGATSTQKVKSYLKFLKHYGEDDAAVGVQKYLDTKKKFLAPDTAELTEIMEKYPHMSNEQAMEFETLNNMKFGELSEQQFDKWMELKHPPKAHEPSIEDMIGPNALQSKADALEDLAEGLKKYETTGMQNFKVAAGLKQADETMHLSDEALENLESDMMGSFDPKKGFSITHPPDLVYSLSPAAKDSFYDLTPSAQKSMVKILREDFKGGEESLTMFNTSPQVKKVLQSWETLGKAKHSSEKPLLEMTDEEYMQYLIDNDLKPK